MDSAFSPLSLVIFGISISFYAFIVQSQTQNGNNGAELAPPAYWVSSPPLPPPPPPPPPPLSLSPPPPPPSKSMTLSFVPPPGAPPPYPNNMPNVRRPPHRRRRHRRPPPPPPPPPPHKMNAGKKVGLLFVGIAAIMQVGVVGFLVIKRRQLLKSDDRRFGSRKGNIGWILQNLVGGT
ncbi:hypothetical protein GYH30_017326 [Glycine max]|nr:hypothetical protein GYH30_017326 [Glycine max]KAH1085281.1 hypothetical protein GYH30_017326 [Glycine max]